MGGGGWRNQKRVPFLHRSPAIAHICFFVVVAVLVCFVFSLLCVLCAHLSACCTPCAPLLLLLLHCLVFSSVVRAYLSSEGGSRRDVLLFSLCLLL